MPEKKTKSVYDLELHETEYIQTNQQTFVVTRVPGGWIYGSTRGNIYSSSFVPFTKEEKPKKNHTSIRVDPEVY